MRNVRLIYIMLSYVFFYNVIKVNHFLYCFVILSHFISSFLHNRFLLVPYAYVSTKSLDCILLLSLVLNAILFTPSVKKLSFSIRNFSCDFSINLLLLINSLWFSLRLSTLTFFLADLICFQPELLLKKFYNF